MTARHGFLAVPEDFLHLGPPSSLPAGEAHGASSLFPPPPRTWQGMVRSRLLDAAGLDLSDHSQEQRARIEALIGSPEALPPGWAFDGPWPAEVHQGRVTAWFPTPRWLRPNPDHRDRWAPLAPVPESAAADLLSDGDLLRSEPFLPLQAGDSYRSKAVGGHVRADLLVVLLSGEIPDPIPAHCWEGGSLPPTADWETRPGLAVDENLHAVDAMLYFLEVVRHWPGAGLAGWLEADLPPSIPADALAGGILRGGSKARPVGLMPLPPLDPAWEQLRSGHHLPAERDVVDGFRFWLYLASPVFLPDPCALQLTGEPDVTLAVRAAVLGDPLVLGGMVRKHEEGTVQVLENRPHVPPGSAWLVDLSGGTAATRLATLRGLHNRCTLGRHQDRPFGFGRTFVGLLSPTAVPGA